MTGAARRKPAEDDITDTMLRLVAGSAKAISPTEVARALGGDKPEGWSPLMPLVRRTAIRLMKEGRIAILRKGSLVDPDDFRGIYKLAPMTDDLRAEMDAETAFDDDDED